MITIILTSTVNVDYNKVYLFQKDPISRKEIYLKSILQWLHKTNFHIIVVDNSGYEYNELDNEKTIYKNRFEVISFKENELEETKYLENKVSKGASEIFSIDYAYRHSTIIHQSNFIIKITCRYFIPELEDYLRVFDLNKWDCLTQNIRNRCEMVGSHYKNFNNIFNINLLNNNNEYDGDVENIYQFRTSKFPNVLICKKFTIELTQRGGENHCLDNI